MPQDVTDLFVGAAANVGADITYVVYLDEGHELRGAASRVDFYDRVEHFLAKYLKGRCEPTEGSAVAVKVRRTASGM